MLRIYKTIRVGLLRHGICRVYNRVRIAFSMDFQYTRFILYRIHDTRTHALCYSSVARVKSCPC